MGRGGAAGGVEGFGMRRDGARHLSLSPPLFLSSPLLSSLAANVVCPLFLQLLGPEKDQEHLVPATAFLEERKKQNKPPQSGTWCPAQLFHPVLGLVPSSNGSGRRARAMLLCTLLFA